MEADADKISMTIQGLIVLSAIPLVMFALWSDYFGRYIERLRAEREQFDPETESARIRLASVSVILFQLLLVIGSSELRRAHPLAVNFILVVAVVLQAWMQARAERKIGKKTETSRAELKKGVLAALWIFGSVMGYVAFVLVCTGAFGLAAQALAVSKPVGFALVCVGSIIGLVGGMAMNFALAPLHLRTLLPTQPLETEFPVLAERFRARFETCGLPAPAFWVIDSTRERGATAFFSGFRAGRGYFRPGLFFSRTLLQKLSEKELQAVINHEISHVLLNHLRKRFFFSASVVSGLTLAGVAVMLISNWAFPNTFFAQQVTPIVAIISFLGAFRWMGHQSQKHEVEADYYAVTRLGTEVSTFELALRKLDQINGVAPDAQSRMHPSTELRIAVLEHVLGKPDKVTQLNPPKTPQNKDDSHDKAA